MRVECFAHPGPWTRIQEEARFAEEAGFDAFTSPEIDNDPFQTLTAACLGTSTVGLRSAIAVAFPRRPMITASASWALQANSGGRFALGLGTQVKGHNERRFSVPWAKPATRLREYVESLRAIWRCWQLGEKLDYRGEFYNFSLMTPEFSPKPNNLPPIPVYTAAVRSRMLKLAGQVSNGVRLHGFCTRRYLTDVVYPSLEEGLAESGRPREQFEVCGGGFIATGPDEEAVMKAREWVRYRLSFYGSTRTYAPVLEAHGWGDLCTELHAMSKTGRWKEMASRISDEVLQAFTAVGTYENIAPEIERRFGGLSDCVELGTPEGVEPGPLREIIQDIQRIPAVFEGHPKNWS